MARMIARSSKIAGCPYGCCSAYRTKPRDRRIGKKMVKAWEKRTWKREVQES